MANANSGFARAVKEALDALGMGVLDRPREFVGAVSDLYDPDSPELTVLYAHGDDRLLHPYALAASQRSTQALAQAAQRAERYLHDMRRVTSADSRAVAWGIAVGVAAHLGVKAPDSPEDERIRREEERRRLEQNERARREEECRRLEEERRRREEEERRRLDEERRRQEESRARLEREEAARKAAEDAARKAEEAKSKSRNRAVAVALAVIACLIVAVAVASGHHSGTTADSGTGSASAADVAKAEGSVDAGAPGAKKDADDASAAKAKEKKEKEEEKEEEHSVRGVGVRKAVGEYSWDELKEISRAIAGAKDDDAGLEIAKEYHLVDSDGKLQGDTKAVKLTDGTKSSVRILGFRHDELEGGGLSGISFEFADVPAEHRMNAELTNEGGWEASEMRSWLNSDFLALLPDDLRACVEPAVKLTNNSGQVADADDGEGVTAVTPTQDLLWLLSKTEVYGSKNNTSDWADVYNAEGTQYRLYADQGVLKQKEGRDSIWWLRSPIAGNDCNFEYVKKPRGRHVAQPRRVRGRCLSRLLPLRVSDSSTRPVGNDLDTARSQCDTVAGTFA